MNTITKIQKNIKSYLPYRTNTIVDIHRVVLPKQSRLINISFPEVNSLFFKHISQGINFYLNLPSIEFLFEFPENHLFYNSRMFCYFRNDEHYYNPLFPNLIDIEHKSHAEVCMGLHHNLGVDYELELNKSNSCNITQLQTNLINEYISLFFTTKFCFRHGLDHAMKYKFGNKIDDPQFFNLSNKLSHSNINLLNELGIRDSFCFVETEIEILKYLVIYLEWSQKSKKNRNYSIFDDFQGNKISNLSFC